jgi:hypothetical protein
VAWTPRGLWELLFMAGTLAAVAWGAQRAWRARDDLSAAFVALAATALFFGSSLWADPFAYTRNLAPLWLLAVAMAAAAPRARAAAWVPAASVALTLLFGLIGGVPRTPW